jgi:hypothetical protein
MKKLREYQIQNANECTEILNKNGLVYLQHTQRTGKTLTALQIAENINSQRVLFITKKKAIESIISDYNDFNFKYELHVTNYESLHKITLKFDLVILDEAHSIGAFPKPSQRTKLLRELFFNTKLIYLSGTPASESYSQWYHQFWISKNSPFKNYTNFYKFAKDFTTPSLIYTSYGQSNDYSKAIVEKIDKEIKNIIHKFTQENAGFTNVLNKHIIEIEMKPVTYNLIKKLKKDNVIIGKNETILADSAVKLMSKQHQLASGTIIFDSGNVGIIDNSKAVYIKENFKGKLAILYYFKEELNMLKEIFGDSITNDIEEFNTTDKHFVGQQYSSAMGINLSKADKLIYLNFGFSGTNFIQSLDRLTIKERLSTDIYFILAKNTLDKKILKVIEQKKNFTTKMYEQISKQNN